MARYGKPIMASLHPSRYGGSKTCTANWNHFVPNSHNSQRKLPSLSPRKYDVRLPEAVGIARHVGNTKARSLNKGGRIFRSAEVLAANESPSGKGEEGAKPGR